MTEKSNEFVPLLFAGDYNVYSVARAFHEAYGITVTDYGKFYSGPCVASKIIDYRVNEHCDEQETFLQLVNDFADEHKDKKVLLIGCGDSYVELAAANKNNFRSNVIAPYIDVDLMHVPKRLIFPAMAVGFCSNAAYQAVIHTSDNKMMACFLGA